MALLLPAALQPWVHPNPRAPRPRPPLLRPSKPIPVITPALDMLQSLAMPRTLPDGRTESPGVVRIYLASMIILAVFYVASAVIQVRRGGSHAPVGPRRRVRDLAPPARQRHFATAAMPCCPAPLRCRSCSMAWWPRSRRQASSKVSNPAACGLRSAVQQLCAGACCLAAGLGAQGSSTVNADLPPTLLNPTHCTWQCRQQGHLPQAELIALMVWRLLEACTLLGGRCCRVLWVPQL